ncbi:PE-PPE domain-containing protein [Nocardia cyriacigeorgica]|uniref:PE-PPE domain-containing protein n=1 Tax=Nocardia cyriacigeorgica TaxID=135487 RepID=UPI0018957989|nr:PE-PPE domain-containing protein [Nocardia cyriacigeorgica]MBF6085145.1 PE-PPE domain-containing protein [Nocardia cyriacigeorgica]
MIDVFTLAGTGEQPNPAGGVYGMPSFVTAHLDPKRFHCTPIRYPASYGPAPWVLGVDYDRSVDIGLQELLRSIRATPNLAGVIGYSQGAAVITRLLNGIAAGHYPDVELAFAAVIANPHHVPEEPWMPYGISGRHPAWPTDVPTFSVANLHDPIPCCPADSPLRLFAEVTEKFSVREPYRWGVDLVERAIFHRNQFDFGDLGWHQALEAVDDALNYLVRGEHTNYATRRDPATGRTLCEDLALQINRLE